MSTAKRQASSAQMLFHALVLLQGNSPTKVMHHYIRGTCVSWCAHFVTGNLLLSTLCEASVQESRKQKSGER
eukprot:1157659-Pelagomonas_calceolata.AAC.2